jgi:CheY-like chemotaxis protein
MANKRPKPEEIVSKLRQVEVLMDQRLPGINGIKAAEIMQKMRPNADDCYYNFGNCRMVQR